MVVRQRTYNLRSDGGLHVVVEEGPDTLRIVAEYDLPPNIRATEPAPGGSADFSVVTCPPGLSEQVASARLAAVVNGGNCLRNLGMNGVVASMALAALTRPTLVQCIIPDDRGVIASIDSRTFVDPTYSEPLTISINPALWQDASMREVTLFHELLHTAFLEDHPYEGDTALRALFDRDPGRYFDQDRVYSCERVCYATTDATRCECARCRSARDCGPPCDRYRACYSTQVGGICPCPSDNRRWYNSLTECAAGCPSGLGCAFMQCIPEASNACKP